MLLGKVFIMQDFEGIKKSIIKTLNKKEKMLSI